MSALERLELLITSTATAAVKDIKAVGSASAEAQAEMSLLQKGTHTTRAALDAVGLSSVSTGTAFKTAAVAGGVLAAVGLVKFGLDSAEAFSHATGEVRAFQNVTGASAEDASRLAVATRLSGVEAGSAETAFFQLNKRIGQSKDTLDEHGASVVKNHDNTVNLTKTVESAATAFQRMHDPAEQTAFVMENFGRGGAALIPLLKKSHEELDDFFRSAAEKHEIFSQDDLNKGREMKLALQELSDTMEGFKLEVGQVTAPVVTQFAQTASQTLVSIDQLAGGVGGLGNVLTKANNFAPWTAAMHDASSVSELLQGNFGAAAGEFARGIPVVGGLIGLFDDGADSTTKFADTQTKLRDAQQTVFELEMEGKTHTQEYANAVRDAKTASDDLNVSTNQATTALQGHAVAVYNSQQAILSKTAADIALATAGLGVHDALDKYNTVLATGKGLLETDEQFNRRVEQAHLAVQQAVLGETNAAAAKAIADAGPNATSAQKAKLATDAQRQALEFLENMIPGLREQLRGTALDIESIPTNHHTTIIVDDSSIDTALGRLNELARAVRSPYIAQVIVQSQGSYDPFGYLHG